MSKVKKQEENLEKELSEVGISNLPDTEFKNTDYKDTRETYRELQ